MLKLIMQFPVTSYPTGPSVFLVPSVTLMKNRDTVIVFCSFFFVCVLLSHALCRLMMTVDK
jgi:hypothetical protein